MGVKWYFLDTLLESVGALLDSVGALLECVGALLEYVGALLECVGALLESVGTFLEYVGTLQFLPNFCLILADFLSRKRLGDECLRRFIFF